MTVRHQELAAGRWFRLSLVEQLANVGSEIERAMRPTTSGSTTATAHPMSRGGDTFMPSRTPQRSPEACDRCRFPGASVARDDQ